MPVHGRLLGKEEKRPPMSPGWCGGQQGEDLSDHPAWAPQGSGPSMRSSLPFAFSLASGPARGCLRSSPGLGPLLQSHAVRWS